MRPRVRRGAAPGRTAANDADAFRAQLALAAATVAAEQRAARAAHLKLRRATSTPRPWSCFLVAVPQPAMLRSAAVLPPSGTGDTSRSSPRFGMTEMPSCSS
jgi:hypothetical protein